MEPNNRVNETLNSLDGIQRATLDPALEAKILARMPSAKVKIIQLHPAFKWMAAACVVILLGINIVSIIQYKKDSNYSDINSNPVYTEYFSSFNTIN